MNKLAPETRAQILHMLCEGSSMRSISRVVGVSINTIAKLLEDAGEACAAFHDEKVRGVRAARVQCDEIWAFCQAKQANAPRVKQKTGEAGDVWTWSAIDADTKLIISWRVGRRDGETAYDFMCDLKDRLANRVQLTSDGLAAYRDAVGGSFGSEKVDYAMLVKLYGRSAEGPRGSAERRYSPAICLGAHKTPVFGQPDKTHVSTSYVERQNLTMRMSMRRFTRLTNGFSKRVANHIHALAIYFVWYNWLRKHSALKTTPAIAAGLTDKRLQWSDIVQMIDDYHEQVRLAAAVEQSDKEIGQRRIKSYSN